MAEYFEKEKVIERIDLSIKSWSADYNSNSPNMVRAYKDVKSRLESIPSADVVPVVHGEWINKTIPYRADVEQRVDCSACKHIFFHTSALTYNYCPNCGAKMDGERRSE